MAHSSACVADPEGEGLSIDKLSQAERYLVSGGTRIVEKGRWSCTPRELFYEAVVVELHR